MGRTYAIGIYTGPSPLALSPSASAHINPVLTRESVEGTLTTSVADPFMLRVDGTWHMFFEALTWRPGRKKGEIALATSGDGIRWEYRQIILAEPFHLSYPYVFAWGSDYYMIPETSEVCSVRLYRADPFPYRWKMVSELVSGSPHVDNCVFHRDGRWWMLTQTDLAGRTLRLFHATELIGPWTEHPRSPVVRGDPRIARSAGRVVSTPDRLIRFAQDCRSVYGESVAAIEITQLTIRDYAESELEPSPLLAGSGDRWNRSGMHHVDPHQLEDGSWIACVDGWSNRIRRPRELVCFASSRFHRDGQTAID